MGDIDRQARYIWFTDGDDTRNPYGAFRKVFSLPQAAVVTEAVLSLFADTAYRLCVNGQYVGFGPVRFDPRHPVYDSYDLRPFLVDGENVITILVHFQNQKTFKNIPAHAALIAWGRITGGDAAAGAGVSIELATGATPWKSRRHTGYASSSPKLSFALGARETYDPAAFDGDWEQPGCNDKDWPEATVLTDTSRFGALTARDIPFMQLTSVAPAAPVKLLPHIPVETLFSFQLQAPYTYTTAFDAQETHSKRIYWSTYIYTPHTQTVTTGVLYEELWLNGQPCTMKQEDPYRPLRFNVQLPLIRGWNYLFAQTEVTQDVYECYLSLPVDRGLALSADKDVSSGRLFRHTQIQPIENDTALCECAAPWPETDRIAERFGGWVYTTEADRAQSPCRAISWDQYGPSADTVAPDALPGCVIRRDDYPHGVTLLVDMGHMWLVIPRIMLRGVAGATVDVLYGDRFTADGAHLRSLSWVPLGDRIACGGSCHKLDWMPVQPRGCRYAAIAIRNAPGDVVIEQMDFRSAQYPVTRQGRFTCSDPLLNRVWEMGALTQSINMEDAYDDCVDRERGLYALDVLIQYHVNLACYGDQALMRRSLRLYAQSVHETGLFRCVYPNTGHYIIPDFALYVVDAFYSYYRYTGDIDFVAEYWDIIMANLAVFMRLSDERADGLLNADPPGKDWPRVVTDNRTGFWGDGARMDNTGVNCHFSSVYLIALRGAAALATALRRRADADALYTRITVLETAIPRAFFDETRGLFADNTDKKHFSPHASLFAVRAGAVSPAIISRLRGTLPRLLQPFFVNGYDPSDGYAFGSHMAFYFLEALYELGLPETAETCIRSGWGWFLTQGLITTPEHFELSSSQCHAWSASPTYILSRHVLGVRFDSEAGLQHVQVMVNAGSLDWARGAFPHPLGVIEVAWHKENGRVVVDLAEAPEGVCVTVCEA